MPIKAHPVPHERAALFARGVFSPLGKQEKTFCVEGGKKGECYLWREGISCSECDAWSRSSSQTSSSSSQKSSINHLSYVSEESESIITHDQVQYCQSGKTSHFPSSGSLHKNLTYEGEKRKDESLSVKNVETIMAGNEQYEEDSDEEALAAARKRTAAFLYPVRERQRQRQQQQQMRKWEEQQCGMLNPTSRNLTTTYKQEQNHLENHNRDSGPCANSFPSKINRLESPKTFDLSSKPGGERSTPVHSIHLAPQVLSNVGKNEAPGSLPNTNDFGKIVEEKSTKINRGTEEDEGVKRAKSMECFAESFSAKLPFSGIVSAMSMPTSASVEPSLLPSPSLGAPPPLTEAVEGKGWVFHKSSLSTNLFHTKDKKGNDVVNPSFSSSLQASLTVSHADRAKRFNHECEDVLHELYEEWCRETLETDEKNRAQNSRRSPSLNKLSSSRDSDKGGIQPSVTLSSEANSIRTSRSSNSVSGNRDDDTRVFVASDHLRKAFTVAASRLTMQRPSSTPASHFYSTRSLPSSSSSSSSAFPFPRGMLSHVPGGLPMSMEEVAALQVAQRNEKRFQIDSLGTEDVKGKEITERSERRFLKGGGEMSSSAWFRTPEVLIAEATARLERFLESVWWLEKLVRDHRFQASVAQFLYRHHKLFVSHVKRSSPLHSKTNEGNNLRGGDNDKKGNAGGGIVSHSHQEYIIFTEFSEHIAKAVHQWLHSHVKDFDEDEFTEDLFDTPVGMCEGRMEGNEGREKVNSDVPMNVASYPVWRIILSISSFPCFVDWVVDFIEEEFQLREHEGTEAEEVVVAGARGLKALLASTYRRKTDDLNVPLTLLKEGAAVKNEESLEQDLRIPYSTTATKTNIVNINTSGHDSLFDSKENGGDDSNIFPCACDASQTQRKNDVRQREKLASRKKLSKDEGRTLFSSPSPSSVSYGFERSYNKSRELKMKSGTLKQAGTGMKCTSRDRENRDAKESAKKGGLTPSTLLQSKSKGIAETALPSSREVLSSPSTEGLSTKGVSGGRESGESEVEESSLVLSSSVEATSPPSLSSQVVLSPSNVRGVCATSNTKDTEEKRPKGTLKNDKTKWGRLEGRRESVGTPRSRSSEPYGPPPPPPLPFSSSSSSTASFCSSSSSSLMGIRTKGSRHLPPLPDSSSTTTTFMGPTVMTEGGERRFLSSIRAPPSPSRLSLSESENSFRIGPSISGFSVSKTNCNPTEKERGGAQEGEMRKGERLRVEVRGSQELKRPSPLPPSCLHVKGSIGRRSRQKSKSKKKPLKYPLDKTSDDNCLPSPLPPPPSLYPF